MKQISFAQAEHQNKKRLRRAKIIGMSASFLIGVIRL